MSEIFLGKEMTKIGSCLEELWPSKQDGWAFDYVNCADVTVWNASQDSSRDAGCPI